MPKSRTSIKNEDVIVSAERHKAGRIQVENAHADRSGWARYEGTDNQRKTSHDNHSVSSVVTNPQLRSTANRSTAEIAFDARWLEAKGIAAFRTLRLFVEIGWAYQEGCKSRNEISERLSRLDLTGIVECDIPVSTASVHRCCRYVEQLFGEKWRLGGSAVLFVRNGNGKSWSGLTPLGMRAWELVIEFFTLERDSTG